jgi:Predicted Co/Zn/Cd cation transporters
VASVIAFFSVRMSSKPADRKHPYGHGKIENVSGVIEGLLIFVAAGLIITEAVKKLFNPSGVSQAAIAAAVMFFSGIVNFCVSRTLYKNSKGRGFNRAGGGCAPSENRCIYLPWRRSGNAFD